MSHSADADDVLIQEWRAALAHAGVAEANFHLIACPGAAVTGNAKAVSFEKGLELRGEDEEGGIVVQPHKIDEANHPANFWRHRVAVFEDVDGEDPDDRAYIAGVLRHEIEHAKQRDAAPEAFGLYDVVDTACAHAAGEDAARYRDLINASPIEADANAAAAQHLRQRHPSAAEQLAAGPDHYLIDQTANPGNPHTLVERTILFLWQMRDVCDDPANLPAGSTFADILDNRVPDAGAGDRWRSLQQQDAAKDMADGNNAQ